MTIKESEHLMTMKLTFKSGVLRRTIGKPPWCKGSTWDSKSFGQSSNLCEGSFF